MKNEIKWVCFILALTVLSPVWAQTYWKGPAGTAANWTDPANWINGVVPLGTSAITNNGIAEISTGAVSNTLVYAGRTTGPGTLRVSSGGELVGADLTIGYGGKLEAFGGNLLCPAKKLLVGTASGTTGTVVMTGGFLSVTNYSVGDTGVGSFVLSNGTLRSTYWQTFVGNSAGSDGTFIQEGGTNDYTVAACYIGFGAGSTGRYILNGGMLDTHSYNISIASSGTGYMEINGGTLSPTAKIFVSFYTNSIGRLVMNNYTNTFADLQIGPDWPHRGGTGTVIQNGGNITITGQGNIGAASTCVSTFIQNGGTQTRNAALNMPSSPGALGTLILSNNAAFSCSNGITLNAGARLEINGANVFCKGVFMKSSDAYAQMTGGNLTVNGKFLVPDGTNAATFYMRGGYLERTYAANQSYMFYIGGAAADSGPGNFIQTGGVVTNSEGIYLGRSSTNHVGRYEISGGTLNSQTSQLIVEKHRVAAFRLKGSAPVVNLAYIRAVTNEFLLEYVLDKSPAHLAPIRFVAEGYRCGHLRVGFDGGVLLTQTNAFTLIDSPSTQIKTWGTPVLDYITRPDTNMWTEALASGNKQSRITLANGYKQADLEIGGTLSASFAEQAMGHVTLANLSTNRLLGLAVRLAVNEKAKTVSALVADLVAAGYTNSVAEVSGVYDIKVVLPPDCVVDKTVKTPSYFAWDFTDVTTSVTNSTITAVKIERMLPPPTGTMIRIL